MGECLLNGASGINNMFPVSVAKGGTGTTTLTSGGILIGAGTGAVTTLSTLTVEKGGTGATSLTSGDILVGNGTNAITSVTSVPVANGGTGATTALGARTNLEVYKECLLYSSSSGTTNTITLSDSRDNYQKIGIYYNISFSYYPNWNGYGEFRGNATGLAMSVSVPSTNGIETYHAVVSVVDTTVTWVSSNQTNIKTTGVTTYTTGPYVKIYKVVGYKY